jgi:hypothetical protein
MRWSSCGRADAWSRCNTRNGTKWIVIPDAGRGREVDPEAAAEIIAHPRVLSNCDALIPHMSQTWRYAQ